ncbi:hypothetical protein [Massilia aerilata]|uniref:Nucleotidyltransferase n=1 Tax=Massilia aerilata TaxID=453817 RepID=A0ABW0RUJ3_9BURK
MANNLKRRGETTADSTAARMPGWQPLSSEKNVNDVTAAVDCSDVTALFGRPFPVQFRHQGAIAAWTRALDGSELWRHWQDPGTLCRDIRQAVSRQVELIYPSFMVRQEESQRAAQTRRILEAVVSTNLKYHLNKGTVIEATPALETLLTNSDVDLGLPMSFVAPPYQTQYLRFGEAAMRYLKVPGVDVPDCVFDGVFCFFSPDAACSTEGQPLWMLELFFIVKRQDIHKAHIELAGETDRGNVTLGEWLDKGLAEGAGPSFAAYRREVNAAVSYVVKVFLYMTLKQARVMEYPAYDAALRRAAGLGERKRAKLLQRAATLYNSIVVGPDTLPPSPTVDGAGSGMAPHWRRGHFRMQPFGTGNQQRKHIFVAPALIHAEQLQGEVPAPKPYRAGPPAVIEGQR